MLSYIKRQEWVHEEKTEGTTRRIDVQHGKFTCIIKVFATGTIQVQGKDCKLKESLTEAKEAIENDGTIGELLPFEIERFPDVLTERIPEVDPVVVRFVRESIVCVKANSLLGGAFLLGGASEKVILLLIDTFVSAIDDDDRKTKLLNRLSSKFISRKYDEFRQSFKSSLNKPDSHDWTHDPEIKIESIFQFCRICRNEAGHPHLPPNLDKGVLLANMGQFVKYVEDLYGLIRYYKENKVVF